MTKPTRRKSALFDDIMKGLEQAIAYQRGEPVDGIRVHRFVCHADGTIHHDVTTESGVKEEENAVGHAFPVPPGAS